MQFLSERGKTKAIASKTEGFMVGNYNVLMFFLSLAL